MKTDTTQLRIQIVEKHANALLAEMQEHGIDAVGIAGGVLMIDGSTTGGSPCHTFYVLDESVVDSQGKQDGQAFLIDIARTMLGTVSPAVEAAPAVLAAGEYAPGDLVYAFGQICPVLAVRGTQLQVLRYHAGKTLVGSETHRGNVTLVARRGDVVDPQKLGAVNERMVGA